MPVDKRKAAKGMGEMGREWTGTNGRGKGVREDIEQTRNGAEKGRGKRRESGKWEGVKGKLAKRERVSKDL